VAGEPDSSRLIDKSKRRSQLKTITIAKMYLPVTALILAAVAIPAAAQQQVPFKGTFQGQDTTIPPTIATAATGTGTHLGQFSLTQEVTANFVNFTDTGSAQWTAANGDSIYTTVVGSAIPGDVVFTITEIHTITGGTGRFSGAQGSFTVHRTHIVAPSADGTHVTFGSFEGTITPPGASH
jgi:hypothetical protein